MEMEADNLLEMVMIYEVSLCLAYKKTVDMKIIVFKNHIKQYRCKKKLLLPAEL